MQYGQQYGGATHHPPPQVHAQPMMMVQQQQPMVAMQGQMQGGYQPFVNVQQSQHYGSYGQNFQQNVFQINAQQALSINLPALFESKKSQRFQAIQAEDLSHIMNESAEIRNYYRITWSVELCKVMIAMLDRNKTGMMEFNEFNELLQCLTYWHQCFCQYDTNRSGFIEAHEIGRCFSEKFGYQLSVTALETILKRYSRVMEDGRALIAFDDFVSCAVRLRAYTEAFRARDRQQHNNAETGNTTFGYDDFLQCVMCL